MSDAVTDRLRIAELPRKRDAQCVLVDVRPWRREVVLREHGVGVIELTTRTRKPPSAGNAARGEPRMALQRPGRRGVGIHTGAAAGASRLQRRCTGFESSQSRPSIRASTR